MSYCTTGDLRAAIGTEALGAFTDIDGDGNYDTSVIQAAIDACEAKIDSQLASRYSVPLVATALDCPDAIRYMCVDMTKWRLLNRTLQPSENFGANMRTAWEDDYKSAQILLDQYATGVKKIPGLTPTGVMPEISVGMAGSDVEKQFTITRHNVGGTSISTDETGSMDTW